MTKIWCFLLLKQLFWFFLPLCRLAYLCCPAHLSVCLPTGEHPLGREGPFSSVCYCTTLATWVHKRIWICYRLSLIFWERSLCESIKNCQSNTAFVHKIHTFMIHTSQHSYPVWFHNSVVPWDIRSNQSFYYFLAYIATYFIQRIVFQFLSKPNSVCFCLTHRTTLHSHRNNFLWLVLSLPSWSHWSFIYWASLVNAVSLITGERGRSPSDASWHWEAQQNQRTNP